jgi:quercetin dioxygenase-like cupin family protein
MQRCRGPPSSFFRAYRPHRGKDAIMKRIIIGLAAVLVISGGIATATPSRGFVSTVLGSTTIDSLSIQPSGESVALFLRVTLEPGGTSGWHSHPAHVFVLVRAGRVALADGDTCTRTVYKEGEVFVETPDHVHKATNVGNEQAVLLATFVGLPPGTPARTDETNPCRT